MRKFLWKPDPPSPKDWQAWLVLAKAYPARAFSLPVEVNNAKLIVDILDQGSLGSCTANAIAQAIRGRLVQLGASPMLAARLYLYFMGRAIDGTTQEDVGTYLRSVLDGARRVGYPAERFWSYDDGLTKFRTRPDDAAVRAGFDQIAGLTYHKLTSMGKQRSFDLRTLLAAGYLVVFGTQVTNKFRDFGPASAPLDVPKPDEVVLGGHALVLANYTSGVFSGPNSWGPTYGKAGWFEMTDAYIEDPRSSDFWVIDHVHQFSEE